MREAKERQEETYRAPKQKIVDAEELAEYRLKKRKEFEAKVKAADPRIKRCMSILSRLVCGLRQMLLW